MVLVLIMQSLVESILGDEASDGYAESRFGAPAKKSEVKSVFTRIMDSFPIGARSPRTRR